MPEITTDTGDLRDNKGKFKKGVSGNRGGRPSTPDDVKKMLKDAAPDAVKLLIETARDNKQPIKYRVQCAETILDRVYGKATQPIDGDIHNTIEVLLQGVTDYAG